MIPHDKVIEFAAMKNTIATFWRPSKGVCIKDLSPNLFLFQFFHEINIRRFSILDHGHLISTFSLFID